jgi:hypothetical protein
LTQAPHDSTLVGTHPHLSGCNCWLDIASLVLANRLRLLLSGEQGCHHQQLQTATGMLGASLDLVK